jgi:hypothetical protein
MKFYLTTIFCFLFFIQLSHGQNNPIDGDKSELPKLNTESLHIETEIELYPIPAIDYLNVGLKNSQLKEVVFEVYNIIGNKQNFEVEIVNKDSYKINVKKFHSGYYLLIIKDPVTRYSKAFKFRKQ